MIECNINNERYIGSSMCKNKNERLYRHKTINNTVSKQIINRNNYEYIILQDIFDIDKKQLLIKEQEYIDKYDCINKKRAYRTEEQKKKYYEKNKEKIKEYKKEYNKKYNINNKEYKKEYNKEYRFFNKYNDVIADYINQINKY